MNILSLLSSQAGDTTQDSNVQVAELCIESPERLSEIAAGLGVLDKPKLVGDCAEVMTKVAEHSPHLILPYADKLMPLMTHKVTKIRWEAAHALALIAHLISEKVIDALPQLQRMLQTDSSVIVRDYVIDMIACAAKTGEQEARVVFPVLKEALALWSGRHRGRVLEGFFHVLEAAPGLAPDIVESAGAYFGDSKAAVQKAAKKLVKRGTEGRR
jgi:hypothetical protein